MEHGIFDQGASARTARVEPKRPNRHGVRARSRRAGALVAALVTALVGTTLGCTTTASPTKKVCVVLESTETLNLYDGQPHPLTIFIYPLSSIEGFEQTHPDDLLAGARPAGVIAPPVPFTIEPSELERTFQDLFPAETTHLGVIADYERAPGDPEGLRKRVVPARCGIFKPKIVLSSRDMLPE